MLLLHLTILMTTQPRLLQLTILANHPDNSPSTTADDKHSDTPTTESGVVQDTPTSGSGRFEQPVFNRMQSY